LLLLSFLFCPVWKTWRFPSVLERKCKCHSWVIRCPLTGLLSLVNYRHYSHLKHYCHKDSFQNDDDSFNYFLFSVWLMTAVLYPQRLGIQPILLKNFEVKKTFTFWWTKVTSPLLWHYWGLSHVQSCLNILTAC